MAQIAETQLQAAEAAASYAQEVRKLHRKRSPRGARHRETDIRIALGRIQSAMGPIRSYMCAYQYGPQTQTSRATRARVEALSKQLQDERRKLWKMKKR